MNNADNTTERPENIGPGAEGQPGTTAEPGHEEKTEAISMPTETFPTLQLDATSAYAAADETEVTEAPASNSHHNSDNSATVPTPAAPRVWRPNYAGFVWGIILIVVGVWAGIELFFGGVEVPGSWVAAGILIIGLLLVVVGGVAMAARRRKRD